MAALAPPADCPSPEACAPAAMAMVDRRWHLKREIQLGHIITTLTVAISAVVYVQKLDQRLLVVETELEHQRRRDNQQDRAHESSVVEMQKRLDRIDEKLDRLIERSAGKARP